MSTGRDTHEDAPTVRPPAVTCIRTSSLLNTGRSRKVAERHTEKSPTHRAEASREEVPTVGSAREATAVVKAEPTRREEASTALVKEECLGLRGAVVVPRRYAGRTRTGAVATECKTERVNDPVRIKTEPEVASPPSCDSIATVMGSLVVSSSTCSERGSTVCTGNDVGDSLEEGSREDGGVEEEGRQGDRRAEEGRQGDRRVEEEGRQGDRRAEEGREGDGGVEEGREGDRRGVEEGREGDGGVEEEGRQGDGGVEEEGRKGDGKSEDGKEGEEDRGEDNMEVEEEGRDDGGADEDRGEDNMEVEEEEEGRDDGRADENGDEDDMEVEEEGSGVDKVILEKGGGPRVGESGVDGRVDVGAPPNTKPASGIIITNTTEATSALLPAEGHGLEGERASPTGRPSGGGVEAEANADDHLLLIDIVANALEGGEVLHIISIITVTTSIRGTAGLIILEQHHRADAGTRDVRGEAVELGGSTQAGGQEKTVVGDKRDRVRISTSTAAVAKTCGKGSDSWSRTVVLNPRYSRTAVGSGTSTMSVGTTQVFDGRQGGWSGPWSNSYAPASACYSRSGGPSSVYSSFGRYAFTERIPPPPPPPPLPPPPAPPQSTTRWPPPPRGNSGESFNHEFQKGVLVATEALIYAFHFSQASPHLLNTIAPVGDIRQGISRR
ncbi:hypothetical protein Pmar_PMAR016113 [Perkinsus marinus ATCC 50983]|uniref:Uncharacterized protein n=1 Tax=Perkinsus marinus (strain ATCC 50983 / TXsc) TaxID=423536 RepID=C5LZ27_PERM5|nr:hypothetical protein Pmar_PMAR016113 [Perkinsus marinus ATCC 50983]EEQ98036.1 hypothetical protein Pmar_PMAR016113 [Perkinsus marinus ATCC 50983]|eukprot:XP_002765319.1 hypothetical protein Pmar_PMAR016113 [Perkinsus marinus ATCC 50983]